MQWLLFSSSILMLSYLGSRGNKYDSLYRVIMAIIMAYVVGFGCVGSADHDGYAKLYSNLESYKLSDFSISFNKKVYAFEIGYVLLNYLGRFLRLGEAGFFFLIALITNLLLVSVIFRYSKHVVFSFLLFITSAFFIQETNLIRQTLSAALLLYGIRFLENKKIWYYVIFVVAAGLIHTSSYLFLFLILFQYIDYKRSGKLIMTTILILWLISLLFLYGFLHSQFLDVLQMFTYYSRYMSSGSLEETSHTVQHDVFNIGFLLVMVHYMFFVRKKELNLPLIIFFLGPIFYNLGPSNYMLFRFSFFFLATSSFVLPNVLYDYRKELKIKTPVLYYIYFLYSLYILIGGYIMKKTPVFFDEMYTLKDFFA